MNKKIHTRWLKVLIIFSLFFWCQSTFSANNYIVEQSFFEDKSGQLSFDQVRDQPYKKINQMLFNGYGDFPIWIKLKIDPTLHNHAVNQIAAPTRLILRISPTYLDHIELFDPAEPSTLPRRLGDHFTWKNNEHASLNFAFEIPRGVQSREIWLRLKTTSTQMMKVEALDEKSFDAVEKIQELIFAIWLGLLVVIFVWSFGIWVVDRDKLVGNFVINQLAVIFHAMVIMGYFRIALDSIFEPKTIDFLGNMIILSFAFIVIRFQYSFHREFSLRAWVRWFFRLLLLCFPVALGLLLSDHIAEALKINVAALFVTSFLIFLIPVFGVQWKQSLHPMISKRSLFAVDLLLLMVGLINLLPALGLLRTVTIAPFVGLSYGLVTGFVFLLLLQHRHRQIKNEQIHAVSTANAVAAAESSKRIEQEKFLAMLTHELKTPLSVLLMAHTSKEGFSTYKNFVGDAISDMQNVLERCILTDQFDSQALVLKIERCDLVDTISKQISLYPQEHFSLQLGPYSAVMIQADYQLLRIVLVNLLDNAIKYTAEGQPIEISLDIVSDVNGEHARLRVANAPGMAGIPDPTKVFTKYYREPRAHAKTGSGLGLYLIENISSAMNGKLVYVPDADLVIFELRLPLAS